MTALDRVDSHVIADDGVLKVIDNQIDTSTGTFQLKAEFRNNRTSLWPGQFVNVRMRVKTVEDGLVVPTQAVQRGPDGDYVYVVGKDDKVQMRNVKVAGEASDTTSLIGSGLKLGERVVTEGQFRLKPGSKVDGLQARRGAQGAERRRRSRRPSTGSRRPRPAALTGGHVRHAFMDTASTLLSRNRIAWASRASSFADRSPPRC